MSTSPEEIKRSYKMSTSHEEIEKSYTLLKSIIKRQEKRIQYHETQAIVLIGGYVAFHAITCFSTLHRSAELHKLWWIPFIFSLMVTLISAPAIANTMTTCLRMIYYYDENQIELGIIYHEMYLAINHQLASVEKRRVVEVDSIQVCRRYVFVYMVFLALIVCTSLNLYALWSHSLQG